MAKLQTARGVRKGVPLTQRRPPLPNPGFASGTTVLPGLHASDPRGAPPGLEASHTCFKLGLEDLGAPPESYLMLCLWVARVGGTMHELVSQHPWEGLLPGREPRGWFPGLIKVHFSGISSFSSRS